MTEKVEGREENKRGVQRSGREYGWLDVLKKRARVLDSGSGGKGGRDTYRRPTL